jgi:hypothetical protein
LLEICPLHTDSAKNINAKFQAFRYGLKKWSKKNSPILTWSLTIAATLSLC